MKKNLLLAVTGLVFSCMAGEGIVDASWLNARVFPELKAPAAMKLPRGKKVDIIGKFDNWLEIAAPDNTPAYVSAVQLDGTKVLRDLNVRIRPAQKAAVIGRLKAGSTVKAVSVPDRYGWVQIAPLAAFRLYVYQSYVKFDPSKIPSIKKPVAAPSAKAEPAKQNPAASPAQVKPETKATVPAAKPESKPAAKKAVTPVSKPAEKKPAVSAVKPAAKKAVTPVSKPTEKKNAKPAVKKELKKDAPPLSVSRREALFKLGAETTAAKPFAFTGVIVAVPSSDNRCTDFAILDQKNANRAFLFMGEDSAELKKFADRDVKLSGFAYEVKGWSAPVVNVVSLKAK